MPIQLLQEFEIEGRFVKVPNDLLRDSRIWSQPAAARAYLLMLSLKSGRIFKNADSLANAVGYTPRAFRKALTALRKIGLIEGGQGAGYVSLRPVDEHSATVDELETAEIEVDSEKLIITELEEQPKRSPTGLSQKDRWELIKEAWNKHKPDSYLQLDGSVNTPVLIAIETQTRRLGVDRDNYDAFIGAVLLGASADDWWSTKDMTASKIFGFGANLDDKKFFNVEKLYKKGLFAKQREQTGVANAEAIRLRQEEEHRRMNEIEAAQDQHAQMINAEYAEIDAAWDETKKEGWESCNNDSQVQLAVKQAREKLGVNESYRDFLAKCFAGYTGELLTPRQFTDARRMISTNWRSTPLVDSYIWYETDWQALAAEAEQLLED